MSAKHADIVNDLASHRILVADVASGALRLVARPEWMVLSSDHAPWTDSLLVEQYRRPPLGEPEISPRAHHISIRLSPSSIMECWIAGGHPWSQLIPPGHVNIAPAGVPMWTRWREPPTPRKPHSTSATKPPTTLTGPSTIPSGWEGSSGTSIAVVPWRCPGGRQMPAPDDHRCPLQPSVPRRPSHLERQRWLGSRV